MALSQLLLVCLAIGATVAHDSCQAPGTTVTTTTTSTTVTSASGDDGDGPVSGRDRQLIRSTWEKARKNGDVGPQILFRLLQRNPGLQQRFSSFANVPQDQLLKNGNFLAQAYTIMAGLNVIIQSSGSRELLAQQVAHLGAAHSPRGVTAAELDQMASVIVDVLGEQLGSGFNKEARNAWQNGLRALNAGIADNLKDAEDVVDPRIGLSPRQIAITRNIWQRLSPKMNKMVAAALVSLLRNQPALQQKFSKFANVPIDSLTGDAEFLKQVAVIIDRVNVQMAKLDQPLKLQGEQYYMIMSHMSRGLGLSDMMAFSQLLMGQFEAAGLTAEEKAVLAQTQQNGAKVFESLKRQ